MKQELEWSVGRREFLRRTLAVGAGASLLPALTRGETPTDLAALQFPEKVPLLHLTDRPPNLEMPLKYFREDLTPNEAFYVRWHLGVLPTRIDLAEYRLKIAGHVERSMSLSLDELKKDFEPVSVVAVNQCSGNSRSHYMPRMPGVQWGDGAMGNARWTGVRLKDLLAKAGAKAKAAEVSFGGMDGPTLPAAPGFAGTPDFVKSLPFDRANDGEVMIAYAMNDRPLPMLNGFPVRLIVPGWYATYWVKALDEITVLDKPFEGFWMAKAYRVPNTPNFQESPTALAKETIPIHRMTTRSLFVQPEPSEAIRAGEVVEVQGIALDGGSGIRKVELSLDDGKTWMEAKLGDDLGRYSWRRWRYNWKPTAGRHRLKVKATNADGEAQTESQWNRSGYARNVIETLELNVA